MRLIILSPIRISWLSTAWYQSISECQNKWWQNSLTLLVVVLCIHVCGRCSPNSATCFASCPLPSSCFHWLIHLPPLSPIYNLPLFQTWTKYFNLPLISSTKSKNKCLYHLITTKKEESWTRSIILPSDYFNGSCFLGFSCLDSLV